MPKLSDLFDVSYGNKLDLNKMTPLSRSAGGVSFVGRSGRNNGISATVASVAATKPYESGLITVALGGAILSSFVQEHPFYTAQNVAVLRPSVPMSFSQKVYMCLCIRANIFRYGAFGREANRTLRSLEVPALKDFPYWVNAEESLADTDYSSPAAQEQAVKLDTESWRKFLMGEIFDIRKGTRLTKAQQHPGTTAYIGAIDNNNGLSNRIVNGPQHPAGTITIPYNGNGVAEAFYQPEPFWASDDVNVIYPKGTNFTPAIGLFLSTVIRRDKYRFSYGRKWGLDRMKASVIRLPAKPTGNPLAPWEPDWEYMDVYIKTLPYSSCIE